MSREKEGYRLNIEMLNARFPDHDLLTRAEVATVLGASVSTVNRHIRNGTLAWGRFNRISKAELARQISA